MSTKIQCHCILYIFLRFLISPLCDYEELLIIRELAVVMSEVNICLPIFFACNDNMFICLILLFSLQEKFDISSELSFEG